MKQIKDNPMLSVGSIQEYVYTGVADINVLLVYENSKNHGRAIELLNHYMHQGVNITVLASKNIAFEGYWINGYFSWGDGRA